MFLSCHMKHQNISSISSIQALWIEVFRDLESVTLGQHVDVATCFCELELNGSLTPSVNH